MLSRPHDDAPRAVTTAGTDDSGRPVEVASLLEEFAEVVAHELRTPLAIVLGAAETVLTHHADAASPQMQDMLRMIRRNAELASLLSVASAWPGTSRPAPSSSPWRPSTSGNWSPNPSRTCAR